MLTAGKLPLAKCPISLQPRTSAGATHRAHLVGVCGSGMKALAELLSGLGWSVSGSDLNATATTIAHLGSRGLRIHPGHDGVFLPADAEILVYSPAVGPENPERQAAARRGIEQVSYSQMLGRLMRGKTGISIAGTHGKSTTTAMTGCILTGAGMSPSVVIGAELCEAGLSGWSGIGQHFVVESCEFQRSFLDLTPKYAAILSVESDHFDCYHQFDELIAAFAEFARIAPRDGRLLIPTASHAARGACLAAQAPVETFGLTSDADWWGADLRPTGAGTRFRIFRQAEFFAEIVLRIPGVHNVVNALAAAALAHMAGAEPVAIRDNLAEFPGIRRRFEHLGSWRGVTLVDDYAHHPTAVKATLRTARERYPERRLWCVFQPHQVSRTVALLPEFARSFGDADEVLVTPVFAAREHVMDEPVVVASLLAAEICSAGVSGRFSASLDRTLLTLDDELLPGDVLITMGAGDIGQVHHAFTRRLSQHHSA